MRNLKARCFLPVFLIGLAFGLISWCSASGIVAAPGQAVLSGLQFELVIFSMPKTPHRARRFSKSSDLSIW